jgi:hypothetical protein
MLLLQISTCKSVLQMSTSQGRTAPREVYLSLRIPPSADKPRCTVQQKGAQAGISTRCLRIAANSPSTAVNETFLLELPDDLSQALAKDVTTIVACRRLHIAHKDSQRLSSGLHVRVCLHDQTASGPAEGIIASGTLELPPGWLCSAALSAIGVLQGVPAKEEVPSELKLDKVKWDALEGQIVAGALEPLSGDIGVQMQLQRVRMWIRDTPTAQELSTSRSQMGYRSLRLAGLDQRWVPVVRDGMQHPAAKVGSLSGSILGLDLGTGIVLEESFVAGVRRETLRSTVQVVNNLDFAVQVRLKKIVCVCVCVCVWLQQRAQGAQQKELQ